MVLWNTIVHISRFINAKSVYFNFKYFPFSTAIRLPVFVSNNFHLKECRGSIELGDEIRTGMVYLGYGNVGIFDKHRSRGIWEVQGKVKFCGNAFLDHGTKISVGQTGLLTFGNNATITAESSVICASKVTLEEGCLVSWDVMVMDTDFHKIYDVQGEIINADKEIVIGKHVWIGARCTILKGAVIPEGSIVAAGTIVSGELPNPGCIYGGQPVKILKEKVQWKA